MDGPVVTVLIAVHNGVPYITEAIESVLGQSMSDLEVVVVDDASTDATVEAVTAIDDPRIRLVRSDRNVGAYAAANLGLASARGAYVARLDADDVCEPDRLERQLDALKRTGARAVVGAAVRINRDGTILRPPTKSAQVMKWALCVVSAVVHSSAMFERAAVTAYGEDRVASDLALWCELSRRGRLAAMDETVVRYREHDRQLSRTARTEQERAGAAIVREHISEITGEDWTLAQATALFATGRWLRTPLLGGLSALRRFDRAWRKDASLSATDRAELKKLTRRVRARHVRTNVLTR